MKWVAVVVLNLAATVVTVVAVWAAAARAVVVGSVWRGCLAMFSAEARGNSSPACSVRVPCDG